MGDYHKMDVELEDKVKKEINTLERKVESYMIICAFQCAVLLLLCAFSLDMINKLKLYEEKCVELNSEEEYVYYHI